MATQSKTTKTKAQAKGGATAARKATTAKTAAQKDLGNMGRAGY